MTACTVNPADPRQPHDLEAVVGLFDAYRRFYGRASDLAGARQFLRERAERGESAVLLARDAGGGPCGFVQLYPSFSSAAMAPVWVLNDLFVAEPARRRGVARQLLAAAVAHARQTGAARMSLNTQVGNAAAQALYESLGWQRDRDFFAYHLHLV